MPEEERLRLQLIAERIELVESWTSGLSEADFLSDPSCATRSQCRCWSSEKLRGVSNETREQAPTIPWQAIISLRHRIAHGYETVDHRLTWQIARQDLPTLATAVAVLLSNG